MNCETSSCMRCGALCPTEQLCSVGDLDLCENCLDSETLVCRECGTRILSDDNFGSDNFPLCQSCYADHFMECSHCDALIRQNDTYYWENDEGEDNPLCHDCYLQARQDNAIQDYYYKPAPIFYGGGPRYFGVELEMDGAGESNANARQLLALSNRGRELAYCKHDGSLDDGFELVTHPMSLDFHQREMPWASILKKAASLGYSSHQTGTCGLHVHVNRTIFGDCETEQDLAIARVLYFFEKHWEELLKFSRRTQRQLDHWAARYGYKERPMDILDHAKKGYHRGRYTCVNLQNQDTVEFRMFRGTLRYNTLIATLQMLDRICDVALFMSDEELTAMSWTTFVSGIQQPELVQYLKERRLYVNEPVEMEVAV